MILLKIFAILIIIFNIYTLTTTKDKNKILLLNMIDEIKKINSLVKFKNTENVRTKCINSVSQAIQRKRIIITIFLLNCWISPIVYLALIKISPIFITLFLIRVLQYLLSKFEISKTYNVWYKFWSIIEIILILVAIYG